MRILVLTLAVLCGLPAFAQQDELVGALEAAMAAPARSEADRDRDDNRKPVETLQFFGLRPDMRVLELLPGGGWYTQLLAPVLADKGQLYVAIGTRRVKESLGQPGFEGIEVLEPQIEFDRSGPFGTNNLNAFDLGVSNIDLALTFRNLHNFTPEARRNINEAVFAALRPGGHFGAVDHTLRHMDPMTQENRRRMDPVLAIQEITAAGFEFVGYSDLHHKPDDELRYEVGRKSVTGNTDRFTLLFRKP